MPKRGRQRTIPRLLFAIALSLAVACGGGSALAANQSVTATPTDQFSPTSVTVGAGESVTWTNGGGQHNVNFDDGSFTQPMFPADPWTAPVVRTFPTAGTFTYYCDAHVLPNGGGMRGTVLVTAGSSGGGGGGGGGGGPSGPPPPGPVKDSVAPKLDLDVVTSQRVVRQRVVNLFVASDEEAIVTVRGTISVPKLSKVYRFAELTKKVAPNVRTKLKLRLAKKARNAVRRALAARARLTAKLTLSVRDRAGNIRTAKRSVKIKR